MDNPMHDLENLETTTLRITDDHEFNPDRIREAEGSVIKIINESGEDHTVTAEDGSFDVEVEAGKMAELFVPSRGAHLFHCRHHKEMKGVLISE